MIEKRGPQCAQLTKGYCKRCACVFRSRKHSGQTAISGATCVTSSDSDRLGVIRKPIYGFLTSILSETVILCMEATFGCSRRMRSMKSSRCTGVRAVRIQTPLFRLSTFSTDIHFTGDPIDKRTETDTLYQTLNGQD